MFQSLRLSAFFLGLVFTVLLTGCATTNYLNGVSPDGKKVYLGPVPIENSEAFRTFQQSPKNEVSEQQYLFQRLKEAPQDLQYFHDGNWYNWLEAYRGGMWLIRNRYQKGQSTRDFLKKYVWRSEANNIHLVKFPDGSIQVGYYLLLNELDLLEETLKKT